MRHLTFWYDFASTYSYLSAMRIAEVAERAGVDVAWQPFLLGPIFKRQGWDTSPFNVYPAKGRYMVRDIERIAAARGLAFRMPAVFPANGLSAARIALLDVAAGWRAAFSRAIFEAEFAAGKDIAEEAVLATISARLDQDFAVLAARVRADETKHRLREATDEAVQLGIFGSPTFTTADGELFWGDDRLESAVNWCRRL